MNKPDWKDAPEWANYLAMDENGAWYWYENKPFIGDSCQWEHSHLGRIDEAYMPSDEWQETLESRPE